MLSATEPRGASSTDTTAVPLAVTERRSSSKDGEGLMETSKSAALAGTTKVDAAERGATEVAATELGATEVAATERAATEVAATEVAGDLDREAAL